MCQICTQFNPYLADCVYEGLPGDGTPAAVPAAGILYAEDAGDAAASTSTAYAIAAGDYFHGTLSSPTESDWVEVTLEAGQTYTFGLTGVGALDAGVDDTYLRLRDASGGLIEERTFDDIKYDQDNDSDPNNDIVSYEWDLNGAGTFGRFAD